MGWASAPYDPRWERRYPARAAAMAAAGPAANLILAVLAFAALKGGIWQGWWARATTFSLDRIVAPVAEEPTFLEGPARFLSILFVLNLLLFLFNLLPFPPLDGASVVSGLISPLRGWIDRLRRSPFGPMLGILAAWTLFPYLFAPVYGWVLALL